MHGDGRASGLSDLRIYRYQIPNQNRRMKPHRFNRDGAAPPFGPLRRCGASRNVHLADDPSAKNVPAGIGVLGKRDGLER